MVFQVYAGLAGKVSQGWHSDCGTATPLTAVDIAGSTSDSVFFSIRNTGQLPITYRYRKDCSYYPTGIWTGVMFLIDSHEGTFVIRYLHVVLDSGFEHQWSAPVTVPSGQTRLKYIGDLSPVSSKIGIKGWDNEEEDCELVGGLTDNGGICSSGPHLHQACSNGKENDCLEADLQNNCQAKIIYDLPDLASSLPQYTSTSTVLFSK